MKVIYIGTASSPEDLDYYASISKKKLVYTQQNWDYSLCKELQNRLNDNLFVYSYPPVDCFPKTRRIFINSRTITNISNGKILGTVLVPYVKQIVVAARLNKEINYLVKQYPDEDIIIITHTIYYQSLKAAFKAKQRHRRLKVVSLVPDLPGFLYRTVKNHAIIDLYNKLTIKAAMNVDAYVCFSEFQMENLNNEKPYIVLNGFVDPGIVSSFSKDSDIISQIESDKNIKLLYAGRLSKEMGIDCLIEAFLSVENNDATLYLCGNGDLVDKIKDMDDDKIKYLGALPRETVISIEKKCDLLLNPRLINEEFSRKSFPSKTFEYLVSGVPVLSSHLRCFSSEYDDYMVYFEDNTKEEYSEKIRYCLRNIISLKGKALAAKRFVLEHRSVKSYCDTLIQFIGYHDED